MSQTQGPQNATSDPELLAAVHREGRTALQGPMVSESQRSTPSWAPLLPPFSAHCSGSSGSPAIGNPTAQASGPPQSRPDWTLGPRLKWCCLAFQGWFVLWNLFPSTHDSRPSPQPLHLGTPGPLDGVGGGHRDLLNFRGLLCDSISQLPSDPRGPWSLSTAAPHVLLGNLRACGFQMPPGPEGQRPRREPPAQPQGSGCCGDGWWEGWGRQWGFVQGLHSQVEPPLPRS